MHQPDRESSPVDSGRAKRRSIFPRSGDAPSVPDPEESKAEAVFAAYQQIMVDRLDEGLRAIRQTANALMHEIAAEVWRTAGGDKDDVRARILEALTRDQAIRSLIAHSDERFQDIAVRTGRLEDMLSGIAEQTHAAAQALAQKPEAPGSAAAADVDEIRHRLDEVTHQLAIALETLAERDRAIVEAVQDQVREHGEVVSRETGRIAQAMQAYVQEGATAIGMLAGNVQTQMEAVLGRDDAIAARVDAIPARIDESVREQMRLLGEQLQFLHDRIGVSSQETAEAIGEMETRTTQRLSASHSLIGNTLKAHEERQREIWAQASGQIAQRINQVVEARATGLAQLVRSDSEALRSELVRVAAAQDEALGRALDQRLERVSEALTSATRWTVEEMTRRVREETTRAIQAGLEETVSAIDRNMVRMVDTLDSEFERLGHAVGRQATQAVDTAVAGRFDATVTRLDGAAAALTRAGLDAAQIQRSTEEAITHAVDARIGALARMIRSDNQALAEQVRVAADQDAAKQALRSIKEMRANLQTEVVGIVDQRMQAIAQQLHRDVQATAESVARMGDLLERKVDEMSARLGERREHDLQIVIDRMGDAMHALASLGREQPADRIDLG